MIIALNQRILQQIDCQVHRVSRRWDHKSLRVEKNFEFNWDYQSENENELNDEVAAVVHYLQAAHISKMSKKVYDNDVSLAHDLIDTLLTTFRAVSCQ